MVKRNDKEPSSENYPFIKETIKERPADRKMLLHKFLTAAVCGVIFGGCAAGTAALILPEVAQSLRKHSEQYTDVTLVPSVTAASCVDEAEDENTSTALANTKPSTEIDAEDEKSGTWAEQVRKVSETPRRALVRIAALGTDSDLLDDSFLKYGEEEGFVFLKNTEAFYIMTYSDRMNDAGNFQVTFSNGDMADAQLCKKDVRTGFYVFRVPFTELNDSTKDEISEAVLATEDNMEQMDDVIAIGSPTGDYDSLVSGMVTSVTGSMKIADEEYGMLTTNMVGSEDGGGILLNMSGEVVGIICSQENENSSVIRAVEADSCDIPRGVYVDAVEEDSPAMTAGVQNADIVHALNGKEISSMNRYSAILQSLVKGSRVKLEVYRKNPYGTYVNVELNVLIKEK